MPRFASRLDPVWVRRVAAASPPPWGPLGYFVAKRTYCRRVDAEGRTEQWHEVVERCVNAALAYGCRLTHEEARDLFAFYYRLQALPGGRMLWQLGTPTMERLGGDSACNCWYTETRGYEDFCFAFDRSMLGGGVGFAADGSRLPVVLGGGAQWVADGGDFSVPDSREGWVELLRRTYRSFFETGRPFSYDTCLVRPAGSPILGFGGTASGPGPLVEGVAKLSKLLGGRVGRRLSSVDVVDIHTIQGEIVKSGNVRRTALISFGRPDDTEYLHAKRWDLGHVPGHRGYINMTVVAEDAEELSPSFWHGFENEGEQFGLYNLRLVQQTDPTARGGNPCLEANLAHREPCDLVELFTPRLATGDAFVGAMRLNYRVAKTILQLPFMDPETQAIVRQNQRLGVGITGIRGARWTFGDYRNFYAELRAEDRRYSREIGANESVKLTVVKPSGTLSLLPGVQPGIHGDVSEHYVRRVRIASDHPLVNAARDHGYYVETALDHNQQPDHRTQIVSFPVSNGVKAGGAIEQLEYHYGVQHSWADQSVSATITFKQEEVPAIKGWLKANYRDGVKAVSFMRDMGHGFTQTPYEPISRDLHRMLSSGTRPMLDVHIERDDYTDAEVASSECAGGQCPLR